MCGYQAISMWFRVLVKLLELDTEKRRISLSYKETLENPWSSFTKKYKTEFADHQNNNIAGRPSIK